MDRQTIALICQEAGKFITEIIRTRPFNKPQPVRPIVVQPSVAIAVQPSGAVEEVEVEEQPPEVAKAPTITEKEKASSIESGCVPCSLGHLSVCSGVINEAMRFGRSAGMGSNEVIDRVSHCIQELNALEREDLTSEMIIDLPPWEKEIAVEALETSRSTRHLLERITSIAELEKAAANTQTAYTQISRKWFKERVARMPQEEKAKLTEKAIETLEKE